jgi:hypothetical protein
MGRVSVPAAPPTEVTVFAVCVTGLAVLSVPAAALLDALPDGGAAGFEIGTGLADADLFDGYGTDTGPEVFATVAFASQYLTLLADAKDEPEDMALIVLASGQYWL